MMYKSLSARAIGLKATLTEVVEAAITHGFGGIDVQIELVLPLANAMGLKYCQQIIQAADSTPGSWVLPTRWQDEDEALFQRDLAELPELAKLAQDTGFTRVTTAVPPTSNVRPLEENLEWSKNRLQQIADVVGACGQQLGLEYLATPSLRKDAKHEFIHSLAGLKQLKELIARDNVGYLLDSWHWHMAGETAADLSSLKAEEIVAIHVNDAPADIPNDEQIDNVRRLPGSTGVIDIDTFLQTISDTGYEGPMTAEPFAAGVRTLNKNRVVELVSESLDRVWFRKDEIAAQEAARAEAARLAAEAAEAVAATAAPEVTEEAETAVAETSAE
ncbi:sugar phosphate isomerase/epimerase family protein [Symmachiella dynata]|uniref:sugar phosphate isomerase/epimerase family protein n=1 Tax=Symmachiella dynata TaxID=2527995 RepID=UPI0011A9252D|nr:sugar phosphate isomerase/epimerase family protein [Symmachiella dynata]